MRVAAVQMAVAIEPAETLATCRSMIGQAVADGADLVVLPELCPPLGRSDEEGDRLISELAEAANEHGCWLVVHVCRSSDTGERRASSLLFDPNGDQVAMADRYLLTLPEGEWLQPGDDPPAVVDTPLGRLGLVASLDCLTFEIARSLAVQGCQLLCVSSASFGVDDPELHLPVRAAENGVWVVAADRVGPIVADTSALADGLGIPADRRHGVGQSQVIAPDGTAFALAHNDREELVVATIDLGRAVLRPDGTDRIASRRPELYGPLVARPRTRDRQAPDESILAAVVQPEGHGAAGISSALRHTAGAVMDGARVVVLPELVFEPDGNVEEVPAAVALSHSLIDKLRRVLFETGAVVVTSIVEFAGRGAAHIGVVVDEDGVVHRQWQLHGAGRHDAWCTERGSSVGVVDLDWGRLAVVVGGDTLFPESFRLAAIEDADVVAAPTRFLEPWEARIGIPERAAENRMCVVAASHPTSAGASLLCTLDDDVVPLTGQRRRFEGTISSPLVTRAEHVAGSTLATIHPVRAGNRLVAPGVDVVGSRPWRQLAALARPDR